MNIPALKRRIDNLSTKLIDEPKEHIARFDNDTFTDAEKVLFRKIEELQEQHGVKLPPEILKANIDLICKANKIIMKYIIGTLRFAILCNFGNPESQRDKNLFDMFLYSCLIDLCLCLREANKYPQSEENFAKLIEKYDIFGKISRIAEKPEAVRSAVEKQEPDLIKTEYSEENDNEHCDTV